MITETITTTTDETAFLILEHAIEYLSDADAIAMLIEAHKAIGPTGQMPSWEVSA